MKHDWKAPSITAVSSSMQKKKIMGIKLSANNTFAPADQDPVVTECWFDKNLINTREPQSE